MNRPKFRVVQSQAPDMIVHQVTDMELDVLTEEDQRSMKGYAITAASIAAGFSQNMYKIVADFRCDTLPSPLDLMLGALFLILASLAATFFYLWRRKPSRSEQLVADIRRRPLQAVDARNC